MQCCRSASLAVAYPLYTASMNMTSVLLRNSGFAFAGFFVFVVFAFWPTYFSRLFDQPTYHSHAHGLAMLLWCLLLIAQAYLIRTNRRDWHRSLGKTSFVLVPVIAITTINFIHFRLDDIPVPQLPPAAYYLLALILNALIVFIALYALAIHYRHQTALHARFMLCTIFPLFTPVTDRLIGKHIPAMVELVPRIDGTPVLPVAGFVLADVILLALTIWDLLSRRKIYAFPAALGLLLLYHASVLTFHEMPFWRRFCSWFLNLPLS